MTVVWSRRAVEHLSKIREYIEEDDPAAAERVAQRIVYCVRTLTNHPLMGRPGRLRGTRELVITGTPYIAPYRVRRNCIEIVAVFHGRRKWPGSF
jgi:toxin ParE1/3/4